METIRFFKRYSTKTKRYFISGKSNDKTFFLNKSLDFNTELYLDNEKFIDGLDIEKTKLKLKEQNKDCNILVFKTAESEKEYCIDKDEIEKRKQERQNKKKSETTDNVFVYIEDLFFELYTNNEDLTRGDIAKTLIQKYNENVQTNEMEEINDDGLPF